MPCLEITPVNCNGGDSSKCIPPYIELDCSALLPCSDDLPLVEFTLINSPGLFIGYDIAAPLVDGQIEVMIVGVDTHGIYYRTLHTLDGSPISNSVAHGPGIPDEWYKLCMRLIRGGEVSNWSYDIFLYFLHSVEMDFSDYLNSQLLLII